MSTTIEWVRNLDGTKGSTWNPVSGCTKISLGCAHCYAERMARRLAGRFGYPDAPNHFDVTLHPDKLELPLRWKKPRMVFVSSMGDLFHEDVHKMNITCIFNVARRASQHTFLFLTKRARRMMEYCHEYCDAEGLSQLPGNFRLGVTVEDQRTADARHEAFEQCPAAAKFVSYEPALSPVDWSGWEFVDQIISGGETGPGARPSHPDWHRAARDFCRDNGAAYFFKAWGAWAHVPGDTRSFPHGISKHWWPSRDLMARVGKNAAGRLLDGRTWNEMPPAARQEPGP